MVLKYQFPDPEKGTDCFNGKIEIPLTFKFILDVYYCAVSYKIIGIPGICLDNVGISVGTCIYSNILGPASLIWFCRCHFSAHELDIQNVKNPSGSMPVKQTCYIRYGHYVRDSVGLLQSHIDFQSDEM